MTELRSHELKEQHWNREKSKLNMLLKQAAALQAEFNDKIAQQDEEIERLKNKAS